MLHFIEKVLAITAFSIEFAWAVLTYVSANHVLDYQFPCTIKVMACIPVANFFLFCATFSIEFKTRTEEEMDNR